jgi:hypothetical protein
VAANPPQKDSPSVMERTCRVVLDVTIRISEITPENVAEYFTPSETGEGLSWEWAERQNRLLSALLVDEENLQEFLRRITRDELHMLIHSAHDNYRSDDELFKQVYSTMNDEDASYFRAAKEEGLLDENLELLDKAFTIGWQLAEIREVSVIKPAED